MLEFLNDAFNYEDRKVGRDKIGTLIVSTALTSDEGYETAILDAAGTHPVERYGTREAADAGHKEWVKRAPTLTTITKLGWLDMVNAKKVTLVR